MMLMTTATGTNSSAASSMSMSMSSTTPGSSLTNGSVTPGPNPTPGITMTAPPTPGNNSSNTGSSSIVSLSIRSEIHRFESVHPSIYSIYELLDQVHDPVLAQAIREHVVNIEDCFVNSQEWTLSRSVSELHVGLLGSQMSPKSTLVHRYLTNAYVQDNSPEGGRFKKEMVLNNTPYLLLLRDEGGPPELQFSHWTDALILVASSANTTNTCFSYITRFANYRSLNEIPIVLVSVEENATPSNLDYIKEFKKIPHSGYFHCNVRNGMNVDLIFSEVANMIVNKKTLMPPPSSNLLPHPTLLQRSNSSLSDKNNTPISTPTTSRKFRRRSNLFKSATQDLGSGRTIPIKQGYLLKKSNNSNSKITNKKWKKKYVTIAEGKLEYFDHINAYMDNGNSGKQIELKHVTVKLTRNNPHHVKTITDSLSTLSLKKQAVYNVEEAYGFQLVSISKTWDFETNSKQERDEWVELIEEQIVKSLQANISDRVGCRRTEAGGGGVAGEEEVAAVKRANTNCADCGVQLSKGGGYWASLNLCVVVCIACSGVHRNLGSHLSKVRSLELDEMSNALLSPLRSIGSNSQANAIYEATLPPNTKPSPSCTPEERSSYIRRKYEALEFLPREPDNVTNEMVVKCLGEKDFCKFLLYVNLARREGKIKRGCSNGDGVISWQDGSLMGMVGDFSAAGQVILWMTNDLQQQQEQNPTTPQPSSTGGTKVPYRNSAQQYFGVGDASSSIPSGSIMNSSSSSNFKMSSVPGGGARVLNNNNNSNSTSGSNKKIVI